MWSAASWKPVKTAPHAAFASGTVRADTFSHHEYCYEASLALHQLTEMHGRVNFLLVVGCFFFLFYLVNGLFLTLLSQHAASCPFLISSVL